MGLFARVSICSLETLLWAKEGILQERWPMIRLKTATACRAVFALLKIPLPHEKEAKNRNKIGQKTTKKLYN